MNMQYLNNTQQKSQCPQITEAFNNLETNFNNIIPNTSQLDLTVGQRRRRRQATNDQQQVLNVGYIQQCIINQGFDFVKQYDVYRYYHHNDLNDSIHNQCHGLIFLY